MDRGGTFTDVIGLSPDGRFHTLKLLSDSAVYHEASVEGIRRMLGLSACDPLPGSRIEAIRFGTTAGTNAFLEGKGGSVALFITEGFADLLEIGYQNRPDIFSLCIRKPRPLFATVFEIGERMNSRGEIIRPLDVQRLVNDVRRLRSQGIDTAAVVTLHSWINPEHEVLCGEILRQEGIRDVFLSHRSTNLIKAVSRGQSTLLDAYLSEPIALFIETLKASTGKIKVDFMQSSGRLAAPDRFTGKNALLSGPAGGVAAVARVCDEAGITEAIGFDMGGTSTDVSRFDGDFELVLEKEIAGIEVLGEMLALHTVASGGGSVLSFDGERMRVGPDSAGSHPGPACYGFGGPLTVTDANLLTGRISPAHFPTTFGRDGGSSIDREVTRKKFEILAAEINTSTGNEAMAEEIALGFLRIANENMALAVKEISVSKGYDVTGYTLVCFGGAGGQHACDVARSLGIRKIAIHPLSGLLSAYGIGISRRAEKGARTVLRAYDRETHEWLSGQYAELEEDLTVRLSGTAPPLVRRQIDLRPRGSEAVIGVDYRGFDDTVAAFKVRYQRQFGFQPDEANLEVANLRVEVLETDAFFPPLNAGTSKKVQMPAAVTWEDVFYTGGFLKAPVYRRESLSEGVRIDGPALVIDEYATVVVDPDFTAAVDDAGILVLERIEASSAPAKLQTKGPDPILLEVFHNLFMSVAKEMGHTLRNTAHSVNMKERLDFSCAVFDRNGDLVANAPHIPVHLGAMADTVKAVMIVQGKDMRPGDVYLSNNPYKGGSHLPDVTTVSPVFSGEDIISYVAARGHHADIGGITPGSVPSQVSHIDEEGVLIDCLTAVRDGVFQETLIREVLSGHRYPVRDCDERILDLRAQVAACEKGRAEVGAVAVKYGHETVQEYMGYIQDNGANAVRQALGLFVRDAGTFDVSFDDVLDDGTPLRARVLVTSGDSPPKTVQAVIDFSGTGAQHVSDNLNATLSVTRSAVLYVLRAIIGSDIPLNSGCLRPVRLIVPQGSLLNPAYPAPVAAGNIETSQRIVDVLLGALGVAAASQGTMNNFLFEVEGDAPYYETIAGGSGGVEGCPGASGVQVHMTNTRITDPEVLEFRHPDVRLERFALRRGSGGKGAFPGGDGIIREIRFLRKGHVTLITERRTCAPYGAQGGAPGAKGVNSLRGADGKIVALAHRVSLEVSPGESIIIETPGGGGFGRVTEVSRCAGAGLANENAGG